MGKVLPFERRHSVNARWHELWDIHSATHRGAIEAEYEDALAHLQDTQRDELDVEQRALAVTRYTLAAIRMHEEGEPDAS